MDSFTPARRFAPLFLTLIGLSVVLGMLPLVQAESADPISRLTQPGLTLLQSDASGIDLIINLPPLTRTPVVVDNYHYEKISLPDYGHIGLSGAPDLPQKAYLILVPPGARPILQVISAASHSLEDITPLPAPSQELLAYDADDPAAWPEVAVAYPPMAQATGLYPAAPVTLGAPFRLRDYRLAPIILQPVQADLARNRLVVYDQLHLAVRFEYPAGHAPTAHTRPESATFARIIRAKVLNYAAGQTWREWQPGAALTGASPCLDANAYRLGVQQTGLYKVTRADLVGLPTIAAAALSMCYEGQEIAIQVQDKNNNGWFDGDDEVWFFGQSIKTRDTQTNIYWLTYGGSGHARMGGLGGLPGSGTVVTEYAPLIHLERDELYQPRLPLSDPNSLYDHWFSQPISYGYAETGVWSAQFALTEKSAESDALVQAEVWGYTENTPHRFQIKLNDHLLGVFEFEGSGEETGPQLFSAEAEAAWVVNGVNQVTVEALPNLGDAVNHRMLVNWVEVAPYRNLAAGNGQLILTQTAGGAWKYQLNGFSNPRVFDVTIPNYPRQVLNTTNTAFQPDENATTFPATYLVTDEAGLLGTATGALTVQKDSPSNLRAAGNAADYIIITQPEFDDALTPLVNWRQSQGLSVKTVYVQDIFDEFGYGRYATQAMRDFLLYAYTAWTGGNESQPLPPAAFVLLAGDSSYDHRNVLGQNGNKDQVPVYLRSGVDRWMGEAAADNQYVAFGEQRDLPFLLLGRLPAENSAEMSVMVNKILAYEATAPAPGWQNRHLFISDNTLQDRVVPPGQQGCVPDPAGDFFGLMDAFLAEHFPAGQMFTRLYYAECYENAPQPHYAYDPLSMGNRFLNAYNSGYEFIVYFGHAGPTLWAAEQFVTLDLLSALNNNNRTPIMLPMTCLEGQSHLTFEGLSESMLKRSPGGAVASFAPTGLQVHTGHDLLLNGFYAGVFDDNLPDLGSAIFSGKLLLKTGASAYQDLHDTFGLLGDPALRFNLWQPQAQLTLPIILKQ